ncbi:MAG TPA: riboflavin biosynthesis protein RibF [Candidatus Eisenbacteria bacterium]|jgi:riboflavin kinase/FMN adenylyltransferase
MPGERPVALTIGVFDGLHRGHRVVVDATVEAARAEGGTAWVVTFDPHPDTVVRGVQDRTWLTPPEERAEILHAWGVDRVQVERFDRSVMGLSPEEFLDRTLGPGAPLRVLVTGPDFRMGRGRVGDHAYLEGLGRHRGFAIRQVPFLLEGGGKISSTEVRRRLEAGEVERAAEMLGRPYALQGRVGSGAGRGSTLGYPTANLETHPLKLLPAAGIYLSENRVHEADYHGVTYVGSAGTFGPGPTRVEVHLLGFEGSLRGSIVTTHLVRRLRPDRVFDSAESLVRAMDTDLAAARSFWGLEARRQGG